MDKRGQVTVFVIIGIVILILAILIFYLRDYGRVVTPTIFFGAEAKREQITSNLKDCADKSVKSIIERAAKQGGDLYPGNYRTYKDSKVPYYCLYIPSKGCLNVMPPLRILENKLAAAVSAEIDKCVDKGIVEGSEFTGTKELKTDISVRRDSVIVTTNYDVSIVNKGVEMPVGKVTTVVNDVPFAELYGVANTIVNIEAITGDFEQLFYMLQKRGLYEIQVDRPYPDKIYILNKKDSDFIYQFAIQGEDTTANL